MKILKFIPECTQILYLIKFTCCHLLLVELYLQDAIHVLQFFPFGLRQQKMSDPIRRRHSIEMIKIFHFKNNLCRSKLIPCCDKSI